MEKDKTIKEFLSEVSDDIERLYRNHPPVIELRGWWWKKYIPHYKRLQKVMQTFIEATWEENHEYFSKQIEKEIKDELHYGRKGLI